MLFAVYSYVYYDKCGDGEHLEMLWKGNGDVSIKKLLKKVLERRDYFEIPKKYDLNDLYRLYADGGLDAVSKVMKCGAIEIIPTNEWLADVR